MRILLLGKGGQLGWEACRTLAPLGEVITLDYPEVDFSRPDTLEEIVERIRPQVIFNAAAYTAVDRAESETEKAHLINAVAPGVLAEKAKQHRALLVHFSTDYVFDGRKGGLYVEQDAARPLNVYGSSKLAGEKAVQQVGGACWVLRTAWVYSKRPESFVGKVLAWARKNQTLQIVDDQIGSPTWARLLAETVSLALAQGKEDIFAWGQEKEGLYHLAGEGEVSRYEWARQIVAFDPLREEQVCREILPVKSELFPTPAARPMQTALDCSKFYRAFGLRVGEWSGGLRLALS